MRKPKPASPLFVITVMSVVGVLLFFFYCIAGDLNGYW